MLDQLLRLEIQELIRDQDWTGLREIFVDWEASSVAMLIDHLPPQEGVLVFCLLPRDLTIETLAYLSSEKKETLVQALGTAMSQK